MIVSHISVVKTIKYKVELSQAYNIPLLYLDFDVEVYLHACMSTQVRCLNVYFTCSSFFYRL